MVNGKYGGITFGVLSSGVLSSVLTDNIETLGISKTSFISNSKGNNIYIYIYLI